MKDKSSLPCLPHFQEQGETGDSISTFTRVEKKFDGKDNISNRPSVKDNRVQYWPQPCQYIQYPHRCPDGSSCVFAHSMDEIYRHPAMYRRNECAKSKAGRQCDIVNCPDWHKSSERRDKWAIYDLHMNPSYCPPCTPGRQDTNGSENSIDSSQLDSSFPFGRHEFNINQFKLHACRSRNNNHDRKMCVNYHNLRDKRRDPNKIPYMPEQCEHMLKKN